VQVDATNLVRRRRSLRAEYQAREGIALSYVPFVVRAAVEALRRHPTFNAHWTEEGLVAERRVHVGAAVAVDDGLIVPVVRDADTLSIHGIGRAIADLAARARAGRFRADDFGGATFTVNSTGWYGSNLTLPIVDVPEVAILTMEAITKRVVVIETPDGDAVAIRPIMNMVIAIDHRANDGAGAGFFLRDVNAWLEAIGPETAIW
jgi:2-oxoisovalerate dehydrogenase E2 component (dihydrolipoyl transacylase)